MKTVSDDLFRLIKSLTKSEKGYFKKFASRNTPGEKNNYIILFEAIEHMEKYDEEELKQKLHKTSFISQLPVYKNYLFNLILKSLQSYSSYESIDTKINEMIQNAKMLEKKTFYKEALRILKKAKSIAVKYENPKAVMEILHFERVILMKMPDEHVYEKRAELHRQQLNLVEMLNIHYQYAWLSDKMVIYVEQKGNFRSEKIAKEIKKIMSNPLIKNYKNAPDYTTKRFYLHIHLFYQMLKSDDIAAHNYMKKAVELINDNKHMMEPNARSYINVLVNYLMLSNLIKDKEGVRDAIIKINELKRRLKNKIPLDLEITILSDTCYAEMLVYIHNGDLKRGRITASKIEDLLRKYKTELPMEMRVVLIINTANFYIMDSSYESALKLINSFLNEIPPSFTKDRYDFARLLQLIIHFELKNYDVIENSIDSVYRFMRERNSIFSAETAVFKFLRQALKTERSKLKPVYEELVYDLEKTQDDPAIRTTLSMFNFIIWAKSKILNKSMAEIIKEEQIYI